MDHRFVIRFAVELQLVPIPAAYRQGHLGRGLLDGYAVVCMPQSRLVIDVFEVRQVRSMLESAISSI